MLHSEASGKANRDTSPRGPHPCALRGFVLHEALREVQVLHLQPRQAGLRLLFVLRPGKGAQVSDRAP